MEETLEVALDWLVQGRSVALAIVVETWGSAPRPAGSVMCCDGEGAFAGSVSGGCVEVAVIEASLDTLRTGRSRLLEFGVSDEQAWSVGLACGGSLRVLVLPAQRGVLQELSDASIGARAAVVATALDDGAQQVITPDATPFAAAAAQALRTDRVQRIEVAGREWLLTPHNPPLRLIVVGAVHIAAALCAMARIAGHAVTLIDPRTAFLRPSQFPGVELCDRWPQEALAALDVDSRCAAVLLSHDPKIDDPALEMLLRSPAYYIGALGSRRTHARRLERLASRGFDAATLARIHGPAGLAIGARTPAEIAVSVLAELTAHLRGATPDVGPH
jgi:xanthine dehydrogenase accessory factor